MGRKPFQGTINLDIRDSTPDWAPYAEPRATEFVKRDPPPNILYIVIDDTGFGAWDVYGGRIRMPNLQKLAERGLVYTNFHTTALCSPTRSSLLNGRNATSNGMSCIEEATTGFPGSNGRIPFENAFLSEVLSERGYATFAIGKWHLAPEEESTMASTKRNWPLGRGFERYYGFLGGETDQWYPDIVHDNHIAEQPYAPNMGDPVNGYHVSKDLTDKAISFVKDVKAIAPDKPWMMYFCPGANHAPHQIWPQLIAKYEYNLLDPSQVSAQQYVDASTFGDGYQSYRQSVFEEMQRRKILDDTLAGPTKVNPHNEGILAPGNSEANYSEGITGVPEGKEWPPSDFVREWGSLTIEEQALFCRMAEIYAAFSTYTDEQIGRLLQYLEDTGQLANTIIVACADNGASAEGGPNGSFNECLFFNDVPDSVEENIKRISDLGTDKSYNHYPTGWAWAFNTPFKYWKRWSGYEGGAAAPFMICGPGVRENVPGPIEYRKQYIHAVDVVPTLYELLGMEAPEVVKGYTQNPIEGISFAFTFDPEYAQEAKRRPYALPETERPKNPDGTLKRVKESQFYSMLGTRGIWHRGWLACTVHAPTPSNWSHFPEDLWELYCLEGDDSVDPPAAPDPVQANDLAGTYGNLLEGMKQAWFVMAGQYNGVPLDDRSTSEILTSPRPQLRPPPFGPEDGPTATYPYTYYPGGSEVPESAAPNVRMRSFSITATVVFPEDETVPASGVLFSHGGRFGGHSLYLLAKCDDAGVVIERRVCYVYNWLGMREQRVSFLLPYALIGEWSFRISFRKDGSLTAALDPTKVGASVAGHVELSYGRGSSSFTPQNGELALNEGGTTWEAWSGSWITQPAKFALCGEGMNIGRDGGQSVSHDYTPSRNELEGATLKEVVVEITNDADPASAAFESRGMMWRD